jgi:predicted nucleic acid-binding protein
LTKTPEFWDASAVVPLCVTEGSTSRAREQLKRSSPVIWWATSIEVRSAIVRLRNTGQLTGIKAAGAISRIERLHRNWRVIETSGPILQLAARCVDNFDLRAGDALQLGAALVWCKERPHGRALISNDRKLNEVARQLGFAVVDLL